MARLRVATMRVPVAQSVRDVMLHADGSAAFLVVCRKVLSRVARARRLRLPNVDAAGLVTDWLVHLIAQYHTHVVRESAAASVPGVGASESALFAETKAGERLAPLVQLVYGLLRSGVLDTETDGGAAAAAEVEERTAALHIALSRLSCSELERAVYPRAEVLDSEARLVRGVDTPAHSGVGKGSLRALASKPYEVLWRQGATVVVDALFRVTVFVGGEGIKGFLRRDGEEGVPEETVVDPESSLAAQLRRRGQSAAQCPDVRWEVSADRIAFRGMFVDDGVGIGGSSDDETTLSGFVSRVRRAASESLRG